jgi:hypothetical protein
MSSITWQPSSSSSTPIDLDTLDDVLNAMKGTSSSLSESNNDHPTKAATSITTATRIPTTTTSNNNSAMYDRVAELSVIDDTSITKTDNEIKTKQHLVDTHRYAVAVVKDYYDDDDVMDFDNKDVVDISCKSNNNNNNALVDWVPTDNHQDEMAHVDDDDDEWLTWTMMMMMMMMMTILLRLQLQLLLQQR